MTDIRYAAVSCSFSEVDGKLAVKRTDGSATLDLVKLNQELAESAYADWSIDSKAVDNFLALCQTDSGACQTLIGSRQDAEFQPNISDDAMTARLTLWPAKGGKKLNQAVIMAALRADGVLHGINEATIAQALAEEHAEELLVAQGELAQNGEAGRWQVLYDESPVIQTNDQKVKLKLRDLAHLIVVKKGEPLLRRFPPVNGKFGMNVKGQVLRSKAWPELDFAAELDGVERAADDPNLLIASQAGQPSLVVGGLIVNPVLHLPSVNLNTGNIDFDGTVHIDGDVIAGMKIKVRGDVIVNGMIEAAQIEAGGNVAVKGGVVGFAEKNKLNKALSINTARIRCAGSLQALFAEYAHIEADQTILISQSVRQSELLSRQKIAVGVAGKSVGSIVGGKTQAGQCIAVASLGNSAGVYTLAQVGYDPMLEAAIEEKKQALVHALHEVDQLQKLLSYFKQNPQKAVPATLNKTEHTRLNLFEKVAGLQHEIAELEAQQAELSQAKISVTQRLYEGVELKITRCSWKIKAEQAGACYGVAENQIVVLEE